MTGGMAAVPAWAWALVAGAFALVAGAALGDAVYQAAQRRTRAAAMLAPTKREQIILRLQGGCGPLRKAAR